MINYKIYYLNKCICEGEAHNKDEAMAYLEALEKIKELPLTIKFEGEN